MSRSHRSGRPNLDIRPSALGVARRQSRTGGADAGGCEIRRTSHRGGLRYACSEIDFDSYLKEAGSGGAHNPPERRTADVPADRCGSIKLRMVGYIKGLHPELHRFRLGVVEALQKGKVGIGDAGAVEKAPCRRAHLAERGKAEQQSVKGGS